MKTSIIISILDSHEIVRRQILHFSRMAVPDTEWIFVDDGSDPPLQAEMKGLTLLRTNDFRPWTWPLARNMGARIARGEYLLFTDIDHILTEAVIRKTLEFRGDKLRFERRFGILDENGTLVDEPSVLEEQWGLKVTSCEPHPNTFAIRQSVYWRLGGFSTRLPQKGDRGVNSSIFNARFKMEVLEKLCEPPEVCNEPVYAFPVGRFCGDPLCLQPGMFHRLSHQQDKL